MSDLPTVETFRPIRFRVKGSTFLYWLRKREEIFSDLTGDPLGRPNFSFLTEYVTLLKVFGNPDASWDPVRRTQS